MKEVTINNYRKDKYYTRVVCAVTKILSRSDTVAPIDVLMEMGNLSKKNYESWKRGQVPYLERVFEGSLSKANRILKIIRFHVHDLHMIPRKTIYHQWGSRKNRILRFSKSGNHKLEEAYSLHYIWNQAQKKNEKSFQTTNLEGIK